MHLDKQASHYPACLTPGCLTPSPLKDCTRPILCGSFCAMPSCSFCYTTAEYGSVTVWGVLVVLMVLVLVVEDCQLGGRVLCQLCVISLYVCLSYVFGCSMYECVLLALCVLVAQLCVQCEHVCCVLLLYIGIMSLCVWCVCVCVCVCVCCRLQILVEIFGFGFFFLSSLQSSKVQFLWEDSIINWKLGDLHVFLTI
jgi:hypothetical protein